MMDADWYCPSCAFDVGECKCEPPKGDAPMSNERMTDAALADLVYGVAQSFPAGSILRVELEQASAALRARPQAVAEGLRYAQALVDVMDGTKDYEIQADTGLPDEDCKRIADARRDAKALLAASQSATGGAK